MNYLRIASISPEVRPGDVDFNAARIIEASLKAAGEHRPDIILFPELSVTGYTCGDLFRQRLLLDKAEEALQRIAEATAGTGAAIVVGAPLRREGRLLNCAAVLANGEVKGIVPKLHLPEYNEFYERRRFEPGLENETLFEVAGARVGIEICEDMWVASSPSADLCRGGAEVILNLSASNDVVGKYEYLLDLIRMTSGKCICGYAYASAGFGESSTDVVYDPKAIIAENGRILARSPRFESETAAVVADIDLDIIRGDRLNSSFAQNAEEDLRVIATGIAAKRRDDILRKVNPLPFVPSGKEGMNMRCREILEIQTAGLARRLKQIGAKKIVVGISGGLDSTLALLVAAKAFDRLGLDRKGIIGITMPGFGTTRRTKSNADSLMDELGVTRVEIPIGKAVSQHFEDIGQDPALRDVTYENSQARERTQILMDYANKEGAIVLGTGDLSELALGWCTYNGDHMSMYAVNASIPKTLVKYLVVHYAEAAENEALRRTLLDIVDTPISPELLPADERGDIDQKTEDLVGPYELHDFFLYNTLRHSSPPKKVLRLAEEAFKEKYKEDEIRHWLKTFYRRFFNQQFKRSCMPDGPKVGSVCLSPRGDWRMPSDASSALWLKELES